MRRGPIRTKFIVGFLLIGDLFGAAIASAWADINMVRQSIRAMYAGPVRLMVAGRSAQRDFVDRRWHYLSATTMPQAKWAHHYAELHDWVGPRPGQNDRGSVRQ